MADSINNVQPTVVKKDEEQKMQRAKKRKSIKRLTRQMKKRCEAKVDEAVNNAKASIDQVTNNEGVDTAKSNGLDSLTISNQRLLRKTKQK